MTTCAMKRSIFVLTLTLVRPGLVLATAPDESEQGLVQCANLIYGRNKTSVCFSDGFLEQISKDTNVRAAPRLRQVKLESAELYEYPFTVMTGEGKFTLTEAQRENLRNYLLHGGFLVASGGCSSKPWNESFGAEIARIFPQRNLERLGADHPAFHTVYDIVTSRFKSGGSRLPVLKGLDIDGKTVLIWSPEGLNDTASVGGDCCCCGGNEIKSAQKINVNLLAYALTH